MSATDLFGATADLSGYVPAKDVKAPDVAELAARKALGRDEKWLLYQWKVLPDDILLVEGMVPSGFRKDGRPIWKGQGEQVALTRHAMDVARDEWEAATGKCARCGGDGQSFAGWNHEKGFRYRTCDRCNGTGVPS